MDLKKIAGICALAGMVAGGSINASAVPVTFGQFQQSGGGNPFTYNFTPANGGGGNGGFVVTQIPVLYRFSVDNSFNNDPTGGAAIEATLTIMAHVDTTQAPGKTKKSFFEELDLTDVVIKANSNGGNLLSITNSTGELSGKGNAASFKGDTGTFDDVNFSSDYLDFSKTINRDFSFSFSSVTPAITVTPDGFINSFTTSGTGTFASDPAPAKRFVPEGSSLGMLSAAVLPLAGLGFGIRRRRANKK